MFFLGAGTCKLNQGLSHRPPTFQRLSSPRHHGDAASHARHCGHCGHCRLPGRFVSTERLRDQTTKFARHFKDGDTPLPPKQPHCRPARRHRRQVWRRARARWWHRLPGQVSPCLPTPESGPAQVGCSKPHECLSGRLGPKGPSKGQKKSEAAAPRGLRPQPTRGRHGRVPRNFLIYGL